MIYLDFKYFSVVCLSIDYEKAAVKTTLTTMGHFFGKKLNFCPSDITCNSIALKSFVWNHISKFLINVFWISNKSPLEISSPRLDVEN